MTTRFGVLARLAVCSAVCALALGACSSGGSSDKSSPTTVGAAAAAQAYVEPGPYPVGITTLQIPSGAQVEVWYPATDDAKGRQDTYDVRALIPDVVKALLTGDAQATFTIDAGRDATVASGRFPLVLFSHGASGIRQQSSFLTAHLASWGMIVAAPDHWSRDLYHSLGRTLGEQYPTAPDPVDDFRATRALLERENTASSSRFAGHVDTAQVGAVGHSAGGGTVLGFAPDEGVKGYVSLASGRLTGGGPSTTATVAPAPLPDKPSLFMAGGGDQVVPVATTEAAFGDAPAPSRLWVIGSAGHLAFADFCTFGNGKGIIGVAESAGLGGFLDAAPQFRRLGEDGCLPPNVPVTETFPPVKHAVTAFLRELFGVDPAPVGLGPAVAGQYAVPVTIDEKL